jgi:hypothetical protein
MNKSHTPVKEGSQFSGDIPFPEATLKFLDGLEVSLHPESSMDHSVMGVHYVLACRDAEGQVAEIKLTFSSRRRNDSAEPGPEFERYIELEPRRGKPLECRGMDYSFAFKAKHPSFVPRDNNYRISEAVPSGGFKIELEPHFLNCLRLFYEPPRK